MTFTSGSPNPVDIFDAIVASDAGLTLISASHSGSPSALSYYDGAISQLGIGAGVMLSTGTALPPESNTSSNYSTDYGTHVNSDLQPFLPAVYGSTATNDASTLNITFEITDPNVRSITLTLVYATEDYVEYGDSAFTDAAGVFVNSELVQGSGGENRALLGYYSSFANLGFTANSGIAMEYDGYTAVMTVVASVVQGTNTIEITIADRGDGMGDSALFVSNLTTLGADASGMYRTVAGTAGSDSVDNSASALPTFYDLGAGSDVLRMGSGEGVVRAGAGDDHVFGRDADDAVSGDDGADDLRGGGGNDGLYGGDDNDLLQGNGGDDVLNGGAGSDRVDYVSASGGVTVNLALGTATGDGTDVIVDVENIFGSNFADDLTGDDGANVLNGRGGSDVMRGAGGNDIYYVGEAGDQVVEASGGGTDSVLSAISYTLTANVENLTLTGAADINGTGNALGNTIIGNNGDNRLNGAGGVDTMRGGAGDDVYFVNDSGDRAIERSGEGYDTVRSSASFTLGNNIECLILGGTGTINGTGNGLANLLIGNSANNILNGGGGADIMRGGQGNDRYIVNDAGDRAIEGSSAGYDVVRSSIAYRIGANVEELVLTGSASISGTGNSGDNRIIGNSGSNILVGLDGNDVLIGLAGDDRLSGGNGNDSLSGGSGNDWIEGGAGEDIFTGGTGADLFTFRDGDFAGLTGATADRIHDFNHSEGDRIRLNFIDANSSNGSSTNEAFAFIGTQGFHHVAGELRYEQIGANTYVYGDTDGDGISDFEIRVDGLQTFLSGDFVL